MSFERVKIVNTHRVKEGARVLEDIARFILNNELLFKKVRGLRHGFIQDNSALAGDPFKEENIRHNLQALVQANCARLQEALRVLEEMSFAQTEKEKYKKLRYLAYEIQNDFYDAVRYFMQHDKLSGLYLIVDLDLLKFSIEEIAYIVNESEVKIVQFRSKYFSKRNFLKAALAFKKQLHSHKLFIVNDHVDIAIDIGDGLHIGQSDYPLERIRDLVPADFVLGISCHNVKEAEAANQFGASYISVGCLFPTQSKKDTTPTSLTTLAEIRAAVNLPLCAIGGINESNLSQVLALNVDMIAVIGAVWNAADPAIALRSLLGQLSTAPSIGVRHQIDLYVDNFSRR